MVWTYSYIFRGEDRQNWRQSNTFIFGSVGVNVTASNDDEDVNNSHNIIGGTARYQGVYQGITQPIQCGIGNRNGKIVGRKCFRGHGKNGGRAEAGCGGLGDNQQSCPVIPSSA